MPITFQCEACGQSYTVGDGTAGKSGSCQQCGHRMTVPGPGRPAPDESDDGLGPVLLEPVAGPRLRFAPISPAGDSRPSLHDALAARPAGGSSSGKAILSGVLTAVVVVGGLAIRAYLRYEGDQGDRPIAPAPLAPAPAPSAPTGVARLPVSRTGPIRLPAFPDLGPSREVAPGIVRHEVTLGAPDPASPPGWSGKLWLYLPAGDHAEHSLPCILITGAGSTLIAGMDLGDGDVPEHLPYARAGFAVLAFELDGKLEDRENASDRDLSVSMERFLDARAGLVNAHIALEYLLAKVPQVDPARLTAAGHSSAGTLALLFAEHEPRLRSCIAYAPVTQIGQHFRQFNGEGSVDLVKGMGFGDLIDQYSPDVHESRLKCPLFLFNSEEDETGFESREMAARLRAAGQPVTLFTVPIGDHYRSMIEQGIPAAIEWLKDQDAPE